MATTTGEKVFVLGGTGNIGSHLVKRLAEAKVPCTVFTRNKDKVDSLFGEHLKSGLVSYVQGDYDKVEEYKEAIKGHTRLFILVSEMLRMGQIKEQLGRIAFESGVRQIVDISSFTVTLHNNSGISIAHTQGEQRLFALAWEKPGRFVVPLRVGSLMTNHHWGTTYGVKATDKVTSAGSKSVVQSWVHPHDVADMAFTVLTEAPEKHGTVTYDAHPHAVTNEERVQILSKVLGRTISFEQVPVQEVYDKAIAHGQPHMMAYAVVGFDVNGYNNPSPHISILTKRPFRSLSDWFQENKSAFNK